MNTGIKLLGCLFTGMLLSILLLSGYIVVFGQWWIARVLFLIVFALITHDLLKTYFDQSHRQR